MEKDQKLQLQSNEIYGDKKRKANSTLFHAAGLEKLEKRNAEILFRSRFMASHTNHEVFAKTIIFRQCSTVIKNFIMPHSLYQSQYYMELNTCFYLLA